MKKSFILLLALMVCIAMPLMAQEEEMEKEEMAEGEEMAAMKPPEPLSDEDNWIIGEWEGWTEGPMGKHKDWQKVELGLDGQFHLIEYKSESEHGTYKGMGAITKDPETGEIVGYWIDNWRGMSEGKGTAEGDIVTMEWEGNMGKMTRTMKKVSDDKFTVTATWTGKDGKTMESKSEMTRVKKMTDKKS